VRTKAKVLQRALLRESRHTFERTFGSPVWEAGHTRSNKQPRETVHQDGDGSEDHKCRLSKAPTIGDSVDESEKYLGMSELEEAA